jgi:ABC-type antimicrobial peptide transport system permease subunit
MDIDLFDAFDGSAAPIQDSNKTKKNVKSGDDHGTSKKAKYSALHESMQQNKEKTINNNQKESENDEPVFTDLTTIVNEKETITKVYKSFYSYFDIVITVLILIFV